MLRCMFRRLLATTLWFFAAWELGSAVQWIAGMNGDLLPATLALTAASLVAFDPLRSLWARRSQAVARNELSPAAQGHSS
jgi:hypothetical protein